MAIFGALAPILIPAAIGAVTSAAFGRNPLQGAVMGGVSGGLLNAAGGAGGLFDLGSGVGKSAVTNGVTSAGTAFGANQAPLTVSSSVGSGVTSGGAANFMQPTMPYQAGLDYPAQLSSKAMSSTSPVVGSGANIGANLNYVNSEMPQKFIDTSASQNLMTGTRAYQQGGLTGGTSQVPTSMISKAYENMKNFVTENPLTATQLGLVAMGGINPPQRDIQVSQGQITRGTPPQTAGTPLRIRRPR